MNFSKTFLWTMAGMTATLGMISLGWVLFLPSLIAMWLLLRNPPRFPQWLGVLIGSGIVLLVIAQTYPMIDSHSSGVRWLIAGLSLWMLGALLFVIGMVWRRRAASCSLTA